MQHEPLALAWVALLGLVVGSFLNVLIHRLPIMIEQSWLDADEHARLDLATPASHCPQCQHPIAWRDKWPVLSFVLLRGRCRHCQARISWQYPLIESLGCALFVGCWLKWGANPAAALAWAGFACTLLALAVIDAKTHWLPDTLTQPLTWAGLIAAAMQWSGVRLPDALAGAVAGYLLLWSVYWLFWCFTRKQGMGQGDFKLLAALGAWFGWQSLLALVLLASCSGLLVAAGLLWQRRLGKDQHIAFGPYLALAGGCVLLTGVPDFLLL